jgi:hypothetical protein
MSKVRCLLGFCGTLFFCINAVANLSNEVPQQNTEQSTYCSTAMGDDIAERQGCCSHHDGVCGCSGDGKAMCCDGTESPSCGC